MYLDVELGVDRLVVADRVAFYALVADLTNIQCDVLVSVFVSLVQHSICPSWTSTGTCTCRKHWAENLLLRNYKSFFFLSFVFFIKFSFGDRVSLAAHKVKFITLTNPVKTT